MIGLDDAIERGVQPLGWTAVVLLRLVIACVLGGLVGAEREWQGRSAGLRTHLLVALASTLLMALAVAMIRQPWVPDSSVHLQADLVRIAQAVMLGVGFMGSGIVRSEKQSVHGLTTAAGLWTVAVLGLAVGLGHYTLAGISTGLVLGSLRMLNWLDQRYLKRRVATLALQAAWAPGLPAAMTAAAKQAGLRVTACRLRRNLRRNLAEVELDLLLSPRQSTEQWTDHLPPGWTLVRQT